MTPDEFRKMRKAAGLTQAQMAERLEVSRRTVISWEAGEFSMPGDIADQIEAAGLQPVGRPAHSPVTHKSHPELYRPSPVKGGFYRNWKHPHWYLQCTTVRAQWTKEQCDQADAFVTTTAHLENFTPMTPQAAVEFMQSFGVELNMARYAASKFGFAGLDVPAPLTDSELLK